MMRTEELIRALAADSKSQDPTPEHALALSVMAGIATTAAVFLTILGARPHFFALLTDPRVLFKLALMAFLALAAGGLVVRLARPGADTTSAVLLLLSVPVLLAFANLAELLTVPASEWTVRLIGTNAMLCLVTIPLLSVVTLAVGLAALRQGAPTHPVFAGAGAGLLAGGIGGFFYAMHCPDDSPLFVAVWYSLAIAIVVGVGAFAGSRCLRW
jgi:hypothetical protein